METKLLVFGCVMLLMFDKYSIAEDGAVAEDDHPAYVAKLNEYPAIDTSPGLRPKDPFPVEKKFKITSAEDDVLKFKKNDLIKISTKNGLKHYRAGRLLNTYKIIPQLTTITIQPQCRVAPCPAIEVKALVYYLDFAKRFIDIRNNTFSISASTYEDASTPAKEIKLSWKRAYGLQTK